jgi:hypothetical protein
MCRIFGKAAAALRSDASATVCAADLTVAPAERPGSPPSDSVIVISIAAVISAETAMIAIIRVNSKESLCIMAKPTPIGLSANTRSALDFGMDVTFDSNSTYI